MVMWINFSEGCGCRFTNIDFPVDFEASTDDIIQDKDIVIHHLRDMTTEDRYCGQSSVVDRKLISDSRKTISTYPVATNIVQDSGISSKNSVFYESDNKVNGSGVDISDIPYLYTYLYGCFYI